ncbi:hypothetical protein ACQP2Y_21655 [Actinoplanes sp. CA-051413]|uniref:hypothetical protein n=1 Tax=Actinoplanes sp. CA-051413 TaxID=3239899 RepID=UPI003D95BA17
MTTMLELLNGLVAKTTEASAAQQASFLNLHNAVGKLQANVARLEQLVRDGEVSEELQTLVTQVASNVEDMRKAADTADDGFEPVEEPVAVEPGAEPANPEVPAEPVPGGVPADETPTVPVEGQPVTDEAPTSRKR